MTREQLRLRYIGTVRQHWRSSIDQSGPTPALLDELVTIAQDYAEAVHKAETGKAPLVAASPDLQETPLEPPSSHRTRTRTRGGGAREQTP